MNLKCINLQKSGYSLDVQLRQNSYHCDSESQEFQNINFENNRPPVSLNCKCQ